MSFLRAPQALRLSFMSDLLQFLSETHGVVYWHAPSISEALAAVVEIACVGVQWDFHNGDVPPDVDSFARLHDYFDANGVGEAFAWPGEWYTDESPGGYRDLFLAFWNEVHDGVDDWLRAGRPPL